jgi:hypothetical protein
MIHAPSGNFFRMNWDSFFVDVSSETVESVAEPVESKDIDLEAAENRLDGFTEGLSLVPIYDNASMYTRNIPHAF